MLISLSIRVAGRGGGQGSLCLLKSHVKITVLSVLNIIRTTGVVNTVHVTCPVYGHPKQVRFQMYGFQTSSICTLCLVDSRASGFLGESGFQTLAVHTLREINSKPFFIQFAKFFIKSFTNRQWLIAASLDGKAGDCRSKGPRLKYH